MPISTIICIPTIPRKDWPITYQMSVVCVAMRAIEKFLTCDAGTARCNRPWSPNTRRRVDGAAAAASFVQRTGDEAEGRLDLAGRCRRGSEGESLLSGV